MDDGRGFVVSRRELGQRRSVHVFWVAFAVGWTSLLLQQAWLFTAKQALEDLRSSRPKRMQTLGASFLHSKVPAAQMQAGSLGASLLHSIMPCQPLTNRLAIGDTFYLSRLCVARHSTKTAKVQEGIQFRNRFNTAHRNREPLFRGFLMSKSGLAGVREKAKCLQ